MKIIKFWKIEFSNIDLKIIIKDMENNVLERENESFELVKIYDVGKWKNFEEK